MKVSDLKFYFFMFWRFKAEKDNKDRFGRTFEEAWKEHALWCFSAVYKNEPDDKEKMDYIFRNSSTYISRPSGVTAFRGDAAYNAFIQIEIHFESFKKYYTSEQREAMKNLLKIFRK